MVVRVPLRLGALLTAVALLGASCAGGAAAHRLVEVRAGERTTVRFVQFTGGQRVFVLQNESSGTAADVYSDGRNQLTKVMVDSDLQALIDAFHAAGLSAKAPSSAPTEAREALIVEHGGRRWVWCRQRAGMQAEEAGFHTAKARFLDAYNTATAFHAGDPQSPPDLRGERDRAQSGNTATQQKLGAPQGRQR
jgi:hypothetical protein